MSLPALLDQRLRLPMVAAPMFLVSNPQLVLACCRSGIVGSFPALNQRESSGFEGWLEEIGAGLQALDNPAPYAVNLIVHNTNPRLQADLRICVEHRVPIVITSLGAVREVVDAVHSYGGLVFHDVTTRRHAEKAAEAGVDGLIAVAAGAGGHAGTWSPFALVAEIRQFFDKTLLLAGCINHGHEILAAQMLGADLACDDASTLQLTLDPHFEYGLLPLEGGLEVGGEHFAVNELAYLGDGRDGLQLQLDPGARVLLLGGAPFGAEIFMWWNFVGHSKGEIARAQKAWEEGDARFGRLDALEGPRLSAPPIPWKIDAE